MEATNVQKDVKPHIVLIDGVKYYSDKPETCRSCFFWKMYTNFGVKTVVSSFLRGFSPSFRKKSIKSLDFFW